MKKFEFDPDTVAGKRVIATSRRAAKIMYETSGLAAFRLVSTPEKAVQVGLLALADGVPTITIAQGFETWISAHPVAAESLGVSN